MEKLINIDHHEIECRKEIIRRILPTIKGLNCSFKYSRSDLKKMKEAFKGRGIIEFDFDNETLDEILEGYEEVAQCLAPDVIGIPLVFLDHRYSDSDLTDIYMQLRKISEQYAKEMKWVRE